jgi:hypothetical protein
MVKIWWDDRQKDNVGWAYTTFFDGVLTKSGELGPEGRERSSRSDAELVKDFVNTEFKGLPSWFELLLKIDRRRIPEGIDESRFDQMEGDNSTHERGVPIATTGVGIPRERAVKSPRSR